MSEDRQQIDPITAEWLIRGARGGSPVGLGRLGDLLAAATSPPGRGELAGEEAAVLAFRAARLASTPESRRKSMLKSALAKVATVKAAIVLAAVGGGGVALAAGSGHLPGVGATGHQASDQPPGRVTGSAHAASGHGSPNAAAHGSAVAAGSVAAGRPAAANGSPSPNLRGLCTAFNAGVGDNPGRALDNPAFTVLITNAGGKDKVAAFCTTVLATPAGAPATHPSNQSTHAAHPGGGNNTHPTGLRHAPSPRSHPAPSPTHSH